MAKNFGQIFWGLLLVILDLSINHIDLLPDFVGYILVALGCSGLATESRHFGRAAALSWILVVFSLIGYALRRDAAVALGCLDIVIDCAMMWFLLGGIVELATTPGSRGTRFPSSNRLCGADGSCVGGECDGV